MVCLCSVGFFSSDKLRLFNYPFFDGIQYLSKVIVAMSLNLKKNCLLLIVFVKLSGSKDCHFGKIGTINARYTSR